MLRDFELNGRIQFHCSCQRVAQMFHVTETAHAAKPGCGLVQRLIGEDAKARQLELQFLVRPTVPVVEALLRQFPAVALLGPRQAGKTTLAGRWRERADGLPLTWILRRPPILRGLIDRGRAKGRRVGRFLLLGSASIDSLRQSSETLVAGMVKR